MKEAPTIILPSLKDEQPHHLDDGHLATGGLSYGEVPQNVQDGSKAVGRLDAEYVVFTTTVGTDVRVAHNLKRVPQRFSLVSCTTDIRIFRGSGAWTDKEVFFDAAGDNGVVTVELA